jgi:hypothetical protein
MVLDKYIKPFFAPDGATGDPAINGEGDPAKVNGDSKKLLEIA